MKKAAYSACVSNSSWVLLLMTTMVLWHAQALMHTSYFSTLLKRYVFRYPDNVIYYFTSSRIDFTEADCSLWGHDGKENKATMAVGCHRASDFTHYCFCTMSAKCQHGEEGNEWVSIFMKVILISWTFWKGPGIPKVRGPYFEKCY